MALHVFYFIIICGLLSLSCDLKHVTGDEINRYLSENHNEKVNKRVWNLNAPILISEPIKLLLHSFVNATISSSSSSNSNSSGSIGSKARFGRRFSAQMSIRPVPCTLTYSLHVDQFFCVKSRRGIHSCVMFLV